MSSVQGCMLHGHCCGKHHETNKQCHPAQMSSALQALYKALLQPTLMAHVRRLLWSKLVPASRLYVSALVRSQPHPAC